MFGFLHKPSSVNVILGEEIHNLKKFIVCFTIVESPLDALKEMRFIGWDQRSGYSRWNLTVSHARRGGVDGRFVSISKSGTLCTWMRFCL